MLVDTLFSIHSWQAGSFQAAAEAAALTVLSVTYLEHPGHEALARREELA